MKNKHTYTHKKIKIKTPKQQKKKMGEEEADKSVTFIHFSAR